MISLHFLLKTSQWQDSDGQWGEISVQCPNMSTIFFMKEQLFVHFMLRIDPFQGVIKKLDLLSVYTE